MATVPPQAGAELVNGYSAVVPFLGNTLSGLSGYVDIGERMANLASGASLGESSGVVLPDLEYLVDVLVPGVDVYAFAVSTNTQGSTFTSRGGWSANIVSESDWNMGTASFQIGANAHPTNSLGMFDDLFGVVDTYATMYYHNDFDAGDPLSDTMDNDNPQASWATELAWFQLSANPHSEYVALGQNGGILDGSFVTAVPEARAWLTLGVVAFGAAAVGIARRWMSLRQAAASIHPSSSRQPLA